MTTKLSMQNGDMKITRLTGSKPGEKIRIFIEGHEVEDIKSIEYTPTEFFNHDSSEEIKMREVASVCYRVWKDKTTRFAIPTIFPATLNYFEIKFHVEQSLDFRNIHSKMKLLFNLANLKRADYL